MDLGQILKAISVIVLPWLLAVTVPTIARARMAFALGDPTPAVRGRVPLNPLTYADPMGTLVLPVLMLVLRVPFLFGWSKPDASGWKEKARLRCSMPRAGSGSAR